MCLRYPQHTRCMLACFTPMPMHHTGYPRPLSEYCVSSLHNMYLLRNQLIGESTIEGYICVLLQSCHSVKCEPTCSLFWTRLIFTTINILDSDREPIVYHGKTCITKVSLGKACEAIIKYTFMVSPYLIIISAEIHCSIPQQDMIASIMLEVFGNSLVSTPVQGHLRIAALPSPEDLNLKGRILLKVCF